MVVLMYVKDYLKKFIGTKREVYLYLCSLLLIYLIKLWCIISLLAKCHQKDQSADLCLVLLFAGNCIWWFSFKYQQDFVVWKCKQLFFNILISKFVHLQKMFYLVENTGIGSKINKVDKGFETFQ